MRYLAFATDLFFTEIPDDQLDQWFIGGDCAGWFYARLLPTPAILRNLEPTMEDWGWIMAVETKGVVVDICIWEYLERPNHWFFGIEAKKKFLKKIDPAELEHAEQTVWTAVEAILRSDNRFTDIVELDDHPSAPLPDRRR